jgi:hypothetical protein
VIALHLLLLAMWRAPTVRDAATAPMATPRVWAIALPPPAPAQPPQATTTAVSTPRAAITAPLRARAKQAPADSGLPQSGPQAIATTADDAQAAPPAAPASTASLDLKLRSERGDAERGGLTDARGSMRRQALNDPRSNQRNDPTRVLPEAVAAARKGDCMKGEFVGAGMGLLSAPFLAAAALKGDCRPLR